ncbi:hypothetical protein NDU88_008659 [Pleurodeles waltl]|uniref:Secreted protein n=1 Tax=Pleurodeles waltl TaxID=8319 RepID=A0AAV7NYG3_PLEWA|nr:hypothetical protein NDU88_008659 [Pleurodeles waltl]
MCRTLATVNVGSLWSGSEVFSGASLWLHTALELRKSRREASCIPLWGIVGRASTSASRAAVNPVEERLLEVEAPEPACV